MEQGDGANNQDSRFAFRIRDEDRFRSRSGRRFPCGTPGCCQGVWNHDNLCGVGEGKATVGQGRRERKSITVGLVLAFREEAMDEDAGRN